MLSTFTFVFTLTFTVLTLTSHAEAERKIKLPLSCSTTMANKAVSSTQFERTEEGAGSAAMANFRSEMRSKVVGQDEAINSIAKLLALKEAGMQPPGRPIGSLLFAGKTGLGKTFVVESSAKVLLGDPRAVVKIDCGEFQHSHDTEKLLGAPPGYHGHLETIPALSQATLNSYHTDKNKITFLLFDEVEKASDALWNLMLGILDKGILTLGDNQKVDFSNTIIILTSNVGSEDVTELIDKHQKRIGFSSATSLKGASNSDTILKAIRKKFKPEFINRLDGIVIFESFTQEMAEEVLRREIINTQELFNTTALGKGLRISMSPKAQSQLLSEADWENYQGRRIQRRTETVLKIPITLRLTSGSLRSGDEVLVDYDDQKHEFVYYRKK